MGLLKKKVERIESLPALVYEVAMHNSTQVTADAEGQFCVGTFETLERLSPSDWEVLAQKARDGARFTLSVFEGEAHELKE
jgi:hypothetical protein